MSVGFKKLSDTEGKHRDAIINPLALRTKDKQINSLSIDFIGHL